MTIKVSKIDASLQRKGFKKTTHSDHNRFYLYIGEEKQVVQTKISHGEDEIRDTLISKMSHQLHLEKSDFIRFVECPLQFEEYIQILKKKDVL